MPEICKDSSLYSTYSFREYQPLFAPEQLKSQLWRRREKTLWNVSIKTTIHQNCLNNYVSTMLVIYVCFFTGVWFKLMAMNGSYECREDRGISQNYTTGAIDGMKQENLDSDNTCQKYVKTVPCILPTASGSINLWSLQSRWSRSSEEEERKLFET